MGPSWQRPLLAQSILSMPTRGMEVCAMCTNCSALDAAPSVHWPWGKAWHGGTSDSRCSPRSQALSCPTSWLWLP